MLPFYFTNFGLAFRNNNKKTQIDVTEIYMNLIMIRIAQFQAKIDF